MAIQRQTNYTKSLSLQNNALSTSTILIIITLFIAILIRLSLALQTADSTLYQYNGEFISILSPDPALYGYYATLLLNGLPHNTDVSMIEYVIYALVKFTPFDLNFIMYYTPALFASFISIPVILILNIYINSKTILFFSGTTAAIGYGFYSRTYLGYFDTDVLNVFFPMMIIFSMILVIRKKDYKYALIGIFFNITYLFWYHSSEPIVYALNGFFILFCFLFYFKESELYKISILFGVSIVKLAFQNKL